MAGIRKRIRHCGVYGHRAKYIQVSCFPYSGNPLPKGRGRKVEVSTPKQKKLNEKRGRRFFEAVVHANFTDGDYFVHLSYDNEHLPENLAKAQQQVRNYVNRMNYQAKKKDLPPVVAVWVTEQGKRSGRIHHHMLIKTELPRELVEDLWRAGFCNADRLKLKNRKNGLAAICQYMAKSQKTMKEQGASRSWAKSGQLIRPWDSINDNPRMMSHKKMALLKELPEDSEQAKAIFEADNPGYELMSLEKEYREEIGQWYFFARMELKQEPEKGREKCT